MNIDQLKKLAMDVGYIAHLAAEDLEFGQFKKLIAAQKILLNQYEKACKEGVTYINKRAQ